MTPKLSYLLLISGPPYGTQNASSAWQFANAVIERGHQILSLFFYQDGVYNASSLLAPASDEHNLHKAWCELSIKNQIPLQVCVAAALRRGVIDHTEAEHLELPAANLQPPFEMAGLGELAKLMLTADRVLQF